MKTILISSILAGVLLFTGCSSKDTIPNDPKETEKNKKQEAEKAVETEIVESDNTLVSDENVAPIADSNEKSMAALEEELQTIYFDYDKFNIRDDMQEILANDVKIAIDPASKFIIKLEGNCDEWGSDEYNFALGLKRASTVKNALVAEGVEQNRITMVSFGESNPTCSDKTQECWSKNRRVDFKLLP